MATLQANWNYPNAIRTGAGRLVELPQLCEEAGIKAPLLVTDPGLVTQPMVADARSLCEDHGLSCGLFSQVQSNPTGENIDAGVAAYRDGAHDGVIALGGGSALDAGKAIALMVGQSRPLWDFEDRGDNWTRVNTAGIAPVIAIPTTAGTGSEVGRASVITHAGQRVKKIIFHPLMLPRFVLLDPELTVSLPAHITAATGMDALSHCLEAFCAPSYHPMADGIALEGIRLVHDHLERAFTNGQDLEARAQMQVASTMGATAFQKGLGGMHALAHSLGAIYGAHHGLLNAILMPYILKANRTAVEPRIEQLARYLGLPKANFEGFMDWILSLRTRLGIPHRLTEIGIDEEKAALVGQMAAQDPSAEGNPVALGAEQYSALFVQAVRGTL
ncbi:iron-containing alcohol dehydrogenase [Ferrimonas balearica]|uniref:iron-containing alcohol dehydrogenase n=1 Tax=Ferrimonas balearica TaxID=44012 RepID=UPI001C99DD9B|nr:iron-containing alcohol dehydrogenase [Ferrimonas balearica]MBY5990984.1 iron-containing alcohol dehydrogenase [Ferrimonas balearica]